MPWLGQKMSNQWTLLLTIYGQNMGRAIKRPTLLNSICISIESIDVLSFASYQHSLMQWYTKTGHKNVVAISTQMVKRLPQDLTKSRKKSLCLNRAVNSVGWQSIFSCFYMYPFENRRNQQLRCEVPRLFSYVSLTKSPPDGILFMVIQLTEVDEPHGVWPLEADRLGESSGTCWLFCSLPALSEKTTP